jgi:hypothetical protein
MAELEWPEDRYHYTFSLSTTGGGGLPDEKPQEKPEEPTAESTTYAAIETPPPDYPERIFTQLRGIVRFPLRTAFYSGLRWKQLAVVGWTVIFGGAVAYQIVRTGQLLSLQAGELAVVWVACSLPILIFPYSKRD